MSLSPGSRLGPYEITAPIGAGGMGEVYKAKDTRLDRTVAILPDELEADLAGPAAPATELDAAREPAGPGCLTNNV